MVILLLSTCILTLYFSYFPSGNLFSIIFILFTSFYILLLKKSDHFKISKKYLLLAVVILLLTNPFFLSHDFVSYATYPKILLHYHQNPWLIPPSAYPYDPWLTQNHWPTSTSRYGPAWTALSAIPYMLGKNNLIITGYLFKVLGSVGFLINILLIKKITKSQKLAYLYALNPYILIESVASPHTDVWMTTFILFALLFIRQKIKSFIFIVLSICVKIVSLPVFLILLFPSLYISLVLSYLGSLIIIIRWSINPWYLYLPITLSYLVWKNKFFRYCAISLSIACQIRYGPYFYLGFFDPNNKIRLILFLICLLPLSIWSLLEFRKFWKRQQLI